MYLDCLVYFNETVLIHSRPTTFRRSNLVEWRTIRKKHWRLLLELLYFGTVAEIFQQQIDPEHFKGSSRDGALCLRTDHPEDLRCRWIEAQQLTKSKERRSTTTRCYVLFTKALYICDKFEGSGFDKSLHLIRLSVRVPLCSLAITTKTIARSEIETSPLSSLLSRIPFRSTPHSDPDRYWPLLMPHMLRDGWR